MASAETSIIRSMFAQDRESSLHRLLAETCVRSAGARIGRLINLEGERDLGLEVRGKRFSFRSVSKSKAINSVWQYYLSPNEIVIGPAPAAIRLQFLPPLLLWILLSVVAFLGQS